MAKSDKTLSDTQEVITDPSASLRRFQELEDRVKQLQKENAELKSNTDPSSSSNILQGLSKSQLNQLSKNLTSMAKCKRYDSDSDDEEQGEESVDQRQLPTWYGDMKPQARVDNIGPFIDKHICAILEHCWHNPFCKEEIIEMFDVQVRPQNCNTVKPLEINSEVKMNKNDRSSDKDLRYIGNTTCGAGKCLAYLIDMCASAEIILHRDYPGDEGWLSLDDFKFDFQKM